MRKTMSVSPSYERLWFQLAASWSVWYHQPATEGWDIHFRAVLHYFGTSGVIQCTGDRVTMKRVMLAAWCAHLKHTSFSAPIGKIAHRAALVSTFVFVWWSALTTELSDAIAVTSPLIGCRGFGESAHPWRENSHCTILKGTLPYSPIINDARGKRHQPHSEIGEFDVHYADWRWIFEVIAVGFCDVSLLKLAPVQLWCAVSNHASNFTGYFRHCTCLISATHSCAFLWRHVGGKNILTLARPKGFLCPPGRGVGSWDDPFSPFLAPNWAGASWKTSVSAITRHSEWYSNLRPQVNRWPQRSGKNWVWVFGS